MPERDDNGLPFMKMHGLGNDFVVIDSRLAGAAVSPGLARALADRHRGVGFDQLAVISDDDQADLRLDFLNADGSVSATCGNATRCVAAHEMARRGRASLTIRTARGVLAAEDAGDGLTRVNMGPPQIAWDEIPLSEAMDTTELPIEGGPVATGMGNPHCTFFVDDAEAIPLAEFGARYEHHPLFPQRTNVEVAEIRGRGAIRLRIWERGAGITLSSGSCACAAAVAAIRRGLTDRQVAVHLDGGRLDIDWIGDGPRQGVWMTGPVAHVFDGRLTPGFLEGVE